MLARELVNKDLNILSRMLSDVMQKRLASIPVPIKPRVESRKAEKMPSQHDRIEKIHREQKRVESETVTSMSPLNVQEKSNRHE